MKLLLLYIIVMASLGVFQELLDDGHQLVIAKFPDGNLYWKIQRGDEIVESAPSDADVEAFEKKVKKTDLPANVSRSQAMRQDSDICMDCDEPIDRHSDHYVGLCNSCSMYADMEEQQKTKPEEPDDDGFTLVEKKSTHRQKKALRGKDGKTGRRFH